MDGTILGGFVASLVAGFGTGIGALAIYLRPTWSKRAQSLMLATSGGVMLSATFFSLIQPALQITSARGGRDAAAITTVGGGIILGAAVLWMLHTFIPHEHFQKGREGPRTFHLGRYWLFVLAIALHNLPEGIAVGVAYASGETSTGLAVTAGIWLQNLPEGLAVAAALIHDGMRRWRAFVIALLTGLVEPVGGLLGASAVTLSNALLPWGLAFAAGAMLFVISGEIIPETHREHAEISATFALVLGFVVMMALTLLLG